MSAILQKANESRLGDSRSRLSYSQNFKTLSPVSASLSNLANYTQTLDKAAESGPSYELQNCLKQRGFVISDNRAVFRRG
jgi:hypothetical protein